MRWFLLAIAGIFAVSLVAQKAEPKRIEFRRGSSSATVQGELRGREQMEYAVGARSTQSLSLQLTAVPPGSLSIKLRDPEYRDLALRAAGQGRWTATLPETGDYQVWVVRKNGKAAVSTYKLRLAIH